MAPTRSHISEADLAPPLLAYLEQEKWDIYQEVEGAGGRCDLVAVKEGKVWIIELKTHLSLALLEQAVTRLPYAHQVSVAVPEPNRNGRRIVRYTSPGHNLLRRLGLGLFEIRTRFNASLGVVERIRPEVHTEAPRIGSLLSCLNPGQKRCAMAGSVHGGQWTKFKDTAAAVLSWVGSHQGSTVKDLVEAMGQLHYASPSSARSSLQLRIEQGVVPGVWKSPDGQLYHAPLGRHRVSTEEWTRVKALFPKRG
jgi:hypothetical protein